MILGISFDTVEDNAAFAKKQSLPFALLCDTDRAMGLAYGACKDAKAGYPQRVSFLIGKDGKLEQIYLKVKPAEHAQQVLDDIAKAKK